MNPELLPVLAMLREVHRASLALLIWLLPTLMGCWLWMDQCNRVLELLGAPASSQHPAGGEERTWEEDFTAQRGAGGGSTGGDWAEEAPQGRHGRSSQGLSLSKGSVES